MTSDIKKNTGSPYNILLVEDDIDSRSLIRELIKKAIPGINFYEAESDAEVFSTISGNTIDCIILDYFLEGTDGLTILKKLRKNKINIPVLILTNQNDDKVAAEMIKEGASDYFSKTVLKEKNISQILKRSITNAIDLYRLWMEKRQARQALEMREKRYRGLIENSPILIMRFFNDEDKMITFVNDGFCKYFNIERYQLLGDGVLSIIHRSLKDEFIEKISSISQKAPIISFEHKGFGKKSNTWQFWNIEGIFNDEGEILEYQCMGEDITDLKATQGELQNSVQKLKELKNFQDGDYFLTSLLLEPFQYNKSARDNITVDVYVKQKKEFTFKKWQREIGGDLCLAHTVNLAGRQYSFFANADAMGKSIQGAGGALVFGAVLQSIINRLRFSSVTQNIYPEQWLRNTFTELQGVFESFDGSMLISAIIGLIDDETGFTFYINADHPGMVLYRNGKAQFVVADYHRWKIGVQQDMQTFQISTFQLEDDDVLISSSDGRDDILLNPHGKHAVLNEDEKLFLRIVENGNGEIDSVLEKIHEIGELTDDLSIIRIYKKKTGKKREEGIFPREVLRAAETLDRGDSVLRQLNSLNEEYPSNSLLLKKTLKVLTSHKMYHEAVPYFHNYLDLRPDDEQTMHAASICLRKCGHLQKSGDLIERLVLRRPGKISYMLDLARIKFALREFMEADRLLDRVLQLDHHNETALKMKQEI